MQFVDTTDTLLPLSVCKFTQLASSKMPTITYAHNIDVFLLNKLAKLREAIVSHLKLSPTDPLTGVGARKCYRI